MAFNVKLVLHMKSGKTHTITPDNPDIDPDSAARGLFEAQVATPFPEKFLLKNHYFPHVDQIESFEFVNVTLKNRDKVETSKE